MIWGNRPASTAGTCDTAGRCCGCAVSPALVFPHRRHASRAARGMIHIRCLHACRRYAPAAPPRGNPRRPHVPDTNLSVCIILQCSGPVMAVDAEIFRNHHGPKNEKCRYAKREDARHPHDVFVIIETIFHKPAFRRDAPELQFPRMAQRQPMNKWMPAPWGSLPVRSAEVSPNLMRHCIENPIMNQRRNPPAGTSPTLAQIRVVSSDPVR